MIPFASAICTSFEGGRRIATGALADVVAATKPLVDLGRAEPIVIFDHVSSQTLEIDFRGSESDVLDRLPKSESGSESVANVPEQPARRAGRPKLGVVGREVTLLPRQWDWLATQPGGASVVLRKLIEEARKDRDFKGLKRDIQESTYRFMSVMAGNRPGFEEASRALFGDDREGLQNRIAGWPTDIRDHLMFLAGGGGLATSGIAASR
jgi:hypothetical protein